MKSNKLGYKQQTMIDFVTAYGRFSLPRDKESQRIALSLARRGLIAINRDLECWVVRPTKLAEKLTA
jgi:hypothetical protein